MKRIIPFFILFILVLRLNAQVVVAKQFGSSAPDMVESVVADSNGNYYVMGTFANIITFDSLGYNINFSTTNNEAKYIVKYDCQDNFQWAIKLDNTVQYAYHGTLRYRNGHIYAAVTFPSNINIYTPDGLKTTKNIGGTSAGLLLKIDRSGAIKWSNIIQSANGRVELNDIEFSSQYDIYITGAYKGTMTVAGQNASSLTSAVAKGSTDAFYMKFNAKGEAKWLRTGGGTSDDGGGSIKLDSKDNLYISHQFSGNATFDSYNVSTLAQWGSVFTNVSTIDGSILWLNYITAPSSVGGGIQTDKFNNIYFIGSFQGSKKFNSFSGTYSKTVISNGGYDIYIAKYSQAGELQWVKNYGGSGDEYSWRSVFRDNKIYMHFQYDATFNVNAYVFNNSGSEDDAVVAIDTSGVMQMAKTITGTGSKKSLAIDYSNTGRLFVGGTFNGNISSGSGALSATGTDDGYLYIYDSVATVSIILNRENAVCNRKSVVVQTGISAGTFLWSPAADINDPTSSSPTISPTKDGFYTLKYTTPEGCIFYDTVFVYMTFCAVTCTNCDVNKSINNGALFCLPFSGNAKDETGNGYDGNVNNATPTSDRYGNANSAYSFDGSTSYIDLAKNLSDLTTASLSFWVKSGTNNKNPYGGMVAWEGDNNCSLFYFLSIKDSSVYIGANKNGKQLDGTVGNGILQLSKGLSNDWNHIVWVMQPTTSSIYLNGVLEATINKTGSLVGNHRAMSIGAMNDGGAGGCASPKDFFFNGSLDDMRLYNRVLSPSEVSYLYDPLDTITVGPDLVICEGDSAILPVPSAANKWKYYIYSGDPNSLIGVNTIRPNISSVYLLKDTTTDCSRYDTIFVTVKTILGVNAGFDSTICEGDTIQLAGAGAGIIKWTPNIDISNVNVPDPFVYPSATTNYIVNVTANGCTLRDTIRISVDIKPKFNLGGTVDLCRKDSVQLVTVPGFKYNWSPQKGLNNPFVYNPYAKPDSNVMYYLKLTAGVCVLNDSVQIIVQDKLPSNSYTKVICLGDSFQLSATGGISYTWNTSYGMSDSTIANPQVSPQVNTIYICKKLSASGCIGRDTITIVVDNTNIIPQVTADTVVCAGQRLLLNASGGATYSWLPGTYLNDSNISNPIAYPENDISYIVFVTGPKGCTKTDTVNVTIKPIAITVNPNPVIACNTEDSIQLNATGCDSYIWSPKIDLSDETIANPKVKPSGTNNIYTVTGSTANGCNRTDTVKIIFSIVKADAGKDSIDACGADSVQLNASGGISYLWAPLTGVDDITSRSPKVLPADPGFYFVLVVDSLGCTGQDSIFLDLKPRAEAYLADTLFEICLDEQLQLDVTGTGYYIWSTGNFDSTIFVSPTENTKYSVVSNPPGYCVSDTAFATVIVHPKPLARFNYKPDAGIRPLPVAFNNTSRGAISYIWHYGNGDTDTIPSPVYIYQNWGKYKPTLLAINSFGCIDSTSGDVLVRDSFYMYVPSAFTPNKNKINDLLLIDYDPENVIDGYIKIFNRWGTKVFECDLKDYKPWDGTFKDVQVAEDIYMLTWYITDKSRAEHYFSGLLTIYR